MHDLERAFESGDANARSAALRSAAGVADAAVVAAVSRGLRDRDVTVRKAAIDVLRWMEHPASVKALQNAARKDSSFKDDAALFAALLKAIGQHADPTSIAILTDDVWSVRDHAVIQARILGLGWIRTRESAEALMDFMKLGGSRKVDPFMTELRVALLRVTGVDQGASCELWLAWWNDHKSRLRIPAETPPLPKGLDARWREYWQLRPKGTARELRGRGERGKDESPDKGEGGSR